MPHAPIDLHSLDAVVGALYTSISGAPEERDWELSKRIFHPQARLVRTRLDADGRPFAHTFSVEEFAADGRELLRDRDFYEIEIARRTLRFGNLAQVFSAYVIKPSPHSEEIEARGMNLLHLYDDAERWWIMHCIWDSEREGVELPPGLFESTG